MHELGALMAAVAAAYAGWKAIYLGPSVPAPEIAYTVESEQAHALALSISYPGDDPALPSELRTLGRALDPSVYVLVGGLSAPACASALREINAVHLPDLHALNAKLDELRGICA